MSLSEKCSSCSNITKITMLITLGNMVDNAVTMTTAVGFFLTWSLPVNLGQSITTRLSECDLVPGQAKGSRQVC